ncbi:hypothetical protein PTI98_004034 [Pleurotus ostreatus]|nr:hypothetical protein PTI98_004034 [Pleurotus ostreatus]
MGVLSQRTTCTNVHMKTTHDARKILYAVETGHLRKVKHCLSKQHQVHAGDIYVWEEQVAGSQAATTGISMQRFMDPYQWSPSRLRGDFLFYVEKYVPTPPLKPTKMHANRKLRSPQPPYFIEDESFVSSSVFAGTYAYSRS